MLTNSGTTKYRRNHIKGIWGMDMFLKKLIKTKPSRIFSYFSLENVDLYIFFVQLIETVEKPCLPPSIPSTKTSSRKSLSSAIVFAFYVVHFMGAPVHVDK